MSDWPNVSDVSAAMAAGESAEPVAPAAEAPAAAPVVEDASAAAPAETSAAGAEPEDILAELADGAETFPRGYVERLRQEALRYRQELKQYRDVFGRYPDEDRQVWFDLAARYADGDVVGVAHTMRNIASAILDGDVTTEIGQQQEAEPAAAQVDDVDASQRPLTEADVLRILEQHELERERKRAEDAAVAEIHSELREAGFDPESPEGFLVLWYASRSPEEGGTGYDLKAAIQKVKDREQSVIRRYLESKRNDAGGASVSPEGVPAAEQPPPATDFPKRSEVEAFLRARSSAQPGI